MANSIRLRIIQALTTYYGTIDAPTFNAPISVIRQEPLLPDDYKKKRALGVYPISETKDRFLNNKEAHSMQVLHEMFAFVDSGESSTTVFENYLEDLQKAYRLAAEPSGALDGLAWNAFETSNARDIESSLDRQVRGELIITVQFRTLLNDPAIVA